MTPEEQNCKLECHDLIVRYFTILDTGPRSSIGEIFTDDGKMLTTNPGGADPREMFTKLPAEFVPIHLTSNIVVNQTGPTTAEGEAYVIAYNMMGKVDDALPRVMPDTPNRIGKILFEFHKTDKGWRMFRFKPGHRFVDDGRT